MNSWEKPLYDSDEYDEWCGVKLSKDQIEDTSKELSTQQTMDYLNHLDCDSFPLPPLLMMVVTVSQSVTRLSTVTNSKVVARKYTSPKSEAYVHSIRESSVPIKTRNNTSWAVKVWTDWASARNKNLLPEELPFSSLLSDLTLSEMNFWLSRYVLEIRKKDGDPYPPNTIYQLVCGLQRFLKEHGRADIKIFDIPEFHNFRGTLDEEMKRLNSTGCYINKKQAQPISIEEEKTDYGS